MAGHACPAASDDAKNPAGGGAVGATDLSTPGAPKSHPGAGRKGRRRGVHESAQVFDLAPTYDEGQGLVPLACPAQVDQH
jgi:hypothetical protein